ncbi:MAG: NACHT domain-containing protein [Spirillospora sp.]
MGRTLLAGSLLVAAGVAVNQILNNGKLSWSWGYLALVFTVLGALVAATPQPPPPAGETVPPPARPARRPWRARHTYLRRMRSSVDQMETIGLVTQAEFVLRTRQVYVDVMLQPKPVTDTVTDSGIGAVASAPGQRDSLASFLTPGRVLAVLGAAGSGKTTLARYTALELAERRWRRGLLPVLLYLRDHTEAIRAEAPETLAQIASAAPWLNGAIPAEWLERRLARGQCVVLLDGLDEVADTDDRRRVVRWVENQISRYPGNAFVVTSRPLGYKDNRLSSAEVLQVQRFTSAQIRAFLHAWYRAIERRSREGDAQEIERRAADHADDLFQRISGRATLYDLAANPMLLTMIANVHRYRSSLPRSRTALYEEMCQVLLHRRQEAKHLTDPELEGLSGERKERIVQELAWHMMRDHLRDIPIAKAERAIRTVLQRTAPNLTPEAFLSHVRRSGLLLEHQHGQYGFAHLTLQEYLAAALVPGHASRRQVLVDNVSDPWWRETTLLWAARSDAGPVVEASLTARTVAALNLAYACANEARELDPTLRTALDELLSATPDDPDEIRLLDGVAAARTLQDSHVLDNSGTRICAHPVPDALWDRYARARTRAEAEANPWTLELKNFLTWLNSLFSDGTSYRLPTLEEAQQALDNDLYPHPGTVLFATDHDWASAHAHARFVLGESARHPFEPAPEQVESYPELIIRHTRPVCELLGARSRLPFASLLGYASPRDLGNPRHQLLHIIDLTIQLAGIFAYYRRAQYASHLDVEDPLPLDDPARMFDLPYARELSRDLDRALGLGDIVERALDAVSAHAFGLITDFSVVYPVLSRAVDSVLGLARASSPAPDQDLARALGRIHEIAEAFASVDVLDQVPDHIEELITVSREVLALETADRGFDADHGFLNLTRDRPHDINLDDVYMYIRGRRADPDPAGYLLRASEEALQRAIHLYDQSTVSAEYDNDYAFSRAHGNVLALAGDLAHARALAGSKLWGVGTATVTGLAGACDQLIRGSAEFMDAERSRRRRHEVVSAPFAQFLQDQFSELRPWHLADDPVMALERARQLANASGPRNIEALISSALIYTFPLWDRSRPVRQSDLVLAVTCVLAALTLCDERATDPELVKLLRGALCALIALTTDMGERSDRAKLVLVRN